jgi:hypothetical protein
MNVQHSWFFSPSSTMKLLEIAHAGTKKAHHRSQWSWFSPMLTWGWLQVARQTEHNAWYSLTDLGLELAHRFLCSYFERAIPFDEFELALQDYFEIPSAERWAWLNDYRQAQEERTKQVLAWLDEQVIAYLDADVNEAYMTWAESVGLQTWHLPEILLMAREKVKARERLAYYEAQRAEKLANYLSIVQTEKLIDEALFMQKYGFAWDQLEILRPILGAKQLRNPSLDKDYWHYPDAPLTPEQTELWLQKGRYATWHAAQNLGISTEQFRKLAKELGIESFEREARANNIWGVAYYRARDIERMRPYLGRVKAPSKRPISSKHLKLWESLSQDQQKLLVAVYREDHINEEDARYEARSRMHAPPASEWRWTPFVRSQLQRRFSQAKLKPTMADFEALQTLGLLEVGTVWLFPNADAKERAAYEAVKMTRLGRAVVRANPKHKEKTAEGDE